MIGTAEAASIANAFGDRNAAVPAHIQERVDVAVLVAGDDIGFGHHFAGHIVAGICNLFFPADTQPRLHEDLFFFSREDLRGRIQPPRHLVRPGPGQHCLFVLGMKYGIQG